LKDDNNIFENLISKSLVGEATAAEEKQLQEWIAENPENEKAFAQSKRVLELSNNHYANQTSESSQIDIDSEWKHFVDTIESNKTKVVAMEMTKPNRWLKIAASIALILASGYIINYYVTKSNVIEYQTADLSQEIILPDQSTVTLNRHSSLSYTRDYGKKSRKVKLNGEAFFEVTPDKEKTFIINTSNSEIQVLGTSFNVQTVGDITEVVVASGIVKFSNKNTNKGIILKAGDKGLLNTTDSDLTLTENKDSNYISWKTRKIVFDESDLNAVLKTLKSVYGTEVSIAPTVSQDCEVTVTFDQQSLDAVLNVLKSTLNLTYQIKGDKIVIIETGC
jgi:transmembrane sensor